MDFNRLYSFILDLISLYNIYGTAISYHAFGENKKHQNCNAETETKKKYMKKLMGCQDTYESGKREISTQWAYTTSIIYLDSPLAHKKGKNIWVFMLQKALST